MRESHKLRALRARLVKRLEDAECEDRIIEGWRAGLQEAIDEIDRLLSEGA
jgi:hypothetical protein